MTDLQTSWLGLELRSPIVVGASPLGDDLAHLEALVGAGAGAVVLRSLFEEQIRDEQLAVHRFMDTHVDFDAEARSFLPPSQVFPVGPDLYLRHLELVRSQLDVPVLASLNGVTPGGWTHMAKRLASAGASAIELNLYEVATDPDKSGADVEARQIEVVRSVVGAVDVPVSVKLSPFYASLPAFASRLREAGARGVVLFNRFYQPDFDLETLDVARRLVPSTSAELPLRLHALAVLSGRVPIELACSGGVHAGRDAAKAILAGATAVQVVSAVLEHGAAAVWRIVEELSRWLGEMGYAGVDDARGVMSLASAPDPHAYERINYARMLHAWRPRRGTARA